MIFIDGVGIGEEDHEKNPFFKYGFSSIKNEFGAIPSLTNQKFQTKNSYLFPVDACLGIEGLPQSGTGQTSIFCGVNASEIIGKHFGPYPYSTLIPIIKEKNILYYYKNLGKKVTFANAYPDEFFEFIKKKKSRLSVTSLSATLSGLQLKTKDDVLNKSALTAEITNERWNQKLGYNLPVLKPSEAAGTLLKIAENNSFTLYEYFLTDHAGHGRYSGGAEEILKILNDFLSEIFAKLNRDEMTLIICSDHGNLEDISIKSHTKNPALTISIGKFASELAESIKDLTDIKPAIIKYCK
jgi:2,3-bisphosphoglycerate-independent phosphoglycerate mutase